MTQEVLQLDPSSIIAENNVRSSLRQSDIDRMCDSIQSVGGVQTPVTVRKDGKKYRLVFGFIRHAAVSKLNQDGAGLTLPAIISDVEDEGDILRRQVEENVARATMSPIDTANAIKRLLDKGVSRTDIRKTFSRPAGTKSKGLAPASNAWVNIHLNLLSLPKAIQKKIHEGAVSVAAAYELGKVPEDKREAVLEAAEKAVERQLAAEENDEARFLKEEQRAKAEAEKVQKAKDAAVKLESDIKEAEAEAKAADALVKAKREAWEKARTSPYDPEDKEAEKKAAEHTAAAKKDYTEAQKIAKKAVNKLADLKSAKSKAADRAREMEEAAKEEKPAKAAVGPAAVKEAAKKAGVGQKSLNISETRVAFKELAKKHKNPKVQAIADACVRLIASDLTPKLMAEEWEAVLAGRAPKK